MPARALLGLVLGAILAGCGGGAHGHWTDPGARLVDGIWIGPQIACPPARDECGVISRGAQVALSDAERSQVVQVAWVSLPSHFVTDAGEQRTPRPNLGLTTWVAALVMLKDGGERAIGLGCELRYAQSGGFDGLASECHPATLTDWQDGAVPLPLVVTPANPAP
ncbi:MAG TPA: hypothetical protein VFC97_01675 [Verrucomicrobiae bacterium]|jgi:hypothetical protein|nr:hypothetical protein [Verrucomicrobiae bacterium]